MATNKYDLYEFEIPSGWRVSKNDFYKIEHLSKASNDDKFNFIYCLEDMLLIENENFHLDLGWYGGKDGQYTVHFFKGTWLDGELLEKYSSNESTKIAKRINEILTAYDNGEFESLIGYVVDENDLNNKPSFGNLKSFEPRISGNSTIKK
ncbi:MAG: hypothetical protein ACPGLV_04670 [Bacteroidia bacterium]